MRQVLRLGAALFVVLAICQAQLYAQGPRAWDGGGGNNNWATVANWQGDLYPSGFFQEYAQILNGATVVVNSDLANLPGDDGYPGALEVTSNSNLQILAGGVFNTDTSIGGAGIDGSARFATGGRLTITGPSASFTSQSLSFANGGIFNPNITGATHSAAQVVGTLTAGGGTLRPTFTITPTPQSWVIADAAAIAGNFTVDQSALGPGQVLRTSVQAGGVHGQQLVLDYRRVAVLNANVDTGALTLSSPSGTPIAITAYSIASNANDLNPAAWSSIDSQGVPGWDVVGTPSSARFDELAGPTGPTTQGSLTLNTTPRSLGAALDENSPFGTAAARSLSFQYVTTAGELVEGLVNYSGLNLVNNLLLTVDTTTGIASLRNSSTTAISLRGYTISSVAGSLKPGAGDWNSLDDQNVPGVDEANGTVNFLSELVPSPSTPLVLAPGQTYALGDLYNTALARDLQLQFVMVPLPTPGDFNRDGIVDVADYTVWRDGKGTVYTSADYDDWQANFGEVSPVTGSVIAAGAVVYQSSAGALLGADAVPEPNSALLVMLGLFGIGFTKPVWCRRVSSPTRSNN